MNPEELDSVCRAAKGLEETTITTTILILMKQR